MVAVAFGEQVIPVGPEFQISRGHDGYGYLNGYAYNVDVARAPSGDFVVVWEEHVQAYQGYDYTNGYRLAARRMHRDGTGAGSQFKIDQQSDYAVSDASFNPAVATTPDDGFVVVWGTYNENPGEEYYDVWAQRFTATNTPDAPKFRVNQTDTGNLHLRHDVATDSHGGFLVVWDGWGDSPSGGRVKARKYDASDNPVTDEFEANRVPNGYYGYPAVAVDASDEFIVAWSNIPNDNPGTAGDGHFAQRVDVDGNLIGDTIVVDTNHASEEWKNHVARGPAGDFMVLGFGYGPNWGDPLFGQLARTFDATGTPTSDEFQLDSDRPDYGTVAADPDGNFVVVWHPDEDYIVGQRFSPTGVPLGSRFAVNEFSMYSHWDWPELATDQYGDFTVVWATNYGDEQNGEPIIGVRARRFAVCGNGRVGPDDACDDGNTAALDGCGATCKVETCHTCSGDPSSCAQLPGCTAVCTNPAAIQPNTAGLSFKGLGAPTGDEGFAFKGKVLNPPLAHLEYDPSADGIELAFTGNALVYGIFGSTAIPPGPPGSGCDPARDGWKVKPGSYVYKNASNALPPACTPGSANGISVVKVKDKLDRDGTLQFRVKARNATIANVPTAPLVATVVLGTSPGAGAAGRCGQITFTGVLGSRFFP